jgi:hypothetical protein
MTDIDPVAVERACAGDRSVRLNRDEMAAAWVELERRRVSRLQIAAILGVSGRQVSRWRAGVVRQPHPRRAHVVHTHSTSCGQNGAQAS